MSALSTIPRLVPGTAEHRQQPHVSASVAAALFGCHPFTTVRQLMALRRGEAGDEAGEAATTGNVLEAVVAEWWAEQHGVSLVIPDETYVYGPLSANPDRLVLGSTTDIVQVKTTSKSEGGVQPYWWYQAQVELACTGAERDHFAVLWGGSLVLRSYIVPRDDAAIAELVARAEMFLAHLEMGLDPPEPAEREAFANVIDVGEGEAKSLLRLAVLNDTARRLKREADAIRGSMLSLLGAPGMPEGSKAQVIHDGRPVARLSVRRGRERTVGTGSFGDPYAVLEAVTQ